MAATQEYLITDTYFSEYVYFALKTATPEVRHRLNTRELACFRSEKAMRDFADHETMERRMVMLTRLGHTWTMCIQTNRLDYDEMFKEHGKEYPYATKASDMVKRLKRGEMFVFGSREMMLYQHLAAQFCHSQVYILDYDYLRIQDAMPKREVVKRIRKSDIDEAVSAYEDFARVAFHSITAFRQVVPTAGARVTDLQLRLLLLLFGYRNKYISVDSIIGSMGEPQRNITVKKSLQSMERSNYVMKLKTDFDTKMRREHSWTITDKGVDVAMTFMKYVKNKAIDI